MGSPAHTCSSSRSSSNKWPTVCRQGFFQAKAGCSARPTLSDVLLAHAFRSQGWATSKVQPRSASQAAAAEGALEGGASRTHSGCTGSLKFQMRMCAGDSRPMVARRCVWLAGSVQAAATTPRLLGTQQMALTTCRMGLRQQHVLRVKAPHDIRGQLHANKRSGAGFAPSFGRYWSTAP